MYTHQEIYDMMVTGAMRDEMPVTDEQIEDAVLFVEEGIDVNQIGECNLEAVMMRLH